MQFVEHWQIDEPHGQEDDHAADEEHGVLSAVHVDFGGDSQESDPRDVTGDETDGHGNDTHRLASQEILCRVVLQSGELPFRHFSR